MYICLRTKRSGVRIPCIAPKEKWNFGFASLFIFAESTRDSNPERVSGVNKIVRRTVFRREVLGGYCRKATVAEDASLQRRLYPLQRANRKPLCIKGLRYFFARFSKFKNHQNSGLGVYLVFITIWMFCIVAEFLRKIINNAKKYHSSPIIK